VLQVGSNFTIVTGCGCAEIRHCNVLEKFVELLPRPAGRERLVNAHLKLCQRYAGDDAGIERDVRAFWIGG
jgi:hypothetical protein